MSDKISGKCVVVGGGLMGLLAARALSLAGATVTLLERGETCRESSWAGGGILSSLTPWQYPDAVSTLVGWSQRYYPVLARELHEETGTDIEWTLCGMLMVDIAIDRVIEAWAEKYHYQLQSLDGVQLASLEPALAVDSNASILLPHVGQLRNPQLCKALRRSLRQRGVTIHEHTPVHGIVYRNGAIEGVSTPRGEYHAEQVVIAGGAWSAQLLRDTGLELPVQPVRGQMIQFQARPGMLQHIVHYKEHYLIPRLDGLILAGSTLEYTGFDKSTTEEARDELVRAATDLVPALSGCELVRHWAGLRPESPEGVPFIGEHPRIRGLFVNAGHFRNGVVMAPASTQLLLDLIRRRPAFTDAEPYAIEKYMK